MFETVLWTKRQILLWFWKWKLKKIVERWCDEEALCRQITCTVPSCFILCGMLGRFFEGGGRPNLIFTWQASLKFLQSGELNKPKKINFTLMRKLSYPPETSWFFTFFDEDTYRKSRGVTSIHETSEHSLLFWVIKTSKWHDLAKHFLIISRNLEFCDKHKSCSLQSAAETRCLEALLNEKYGLFV